MNIAEYLLKYRRVLIIFVHIGLIVCAYFLAYLLRFDFNINHDYFVVFKRTVLLLTAVKLVVFAHFGLFVGLWRYASIDDIWKIIKANILSSFIFIVIVVLISSPPGFSRSVFFLDGLLCTGFLAGVRFATRLFREKFKPAYMQARKKALIVGAGETGVIVLRECRQNANMNVEVVGFIDDSPTKRHLSIQGVRILGTRDDIQDIVARFGVNEIIIAMPSVKGEVIRDIIARCSLPDVRLKIVPRLDKLFNGELELKPRDIKPEDLLGREAIDVNQGEISSYLRNKKVLVTGAGGSIGSELCRQIIRYNPQELILWDHNENEVYFLGVEFKLKYPGVKFRTVIGDIKDIGLLKHVFSHYKPQVVFHAAAHKHVSLMEENPVAAIKNNVIGSRNLIYSSSHYKVERFVLISTDKAVNPTSIMGMAKRITEMMLQAKAKRSKTKFMAVRFGNVIGSAGSVVPLFKKQIELGGPITITHPSAKRYFMSIKEAASLVLQAAALGTGGEIFILDMGEQINITDIARNLLTLSGLTLGKDISFKYVGLRQGEKLSEELFLNDEKHKMTKNKKIFITEANHLDPKRLRKQIKELEQMANSMDRSGVVSKIKEIIS